MTWEMTIDGNRFSNLDEFYYVMDELLTRDLTWPTGHNYAALEDLLCGGFGVHEYGEPIHFTWIHAAKSRRDLGYGATIRYLENLLEDCHPSARQKLAADLQQTRERKGPTLFDDMVEIILRKDSAYDHTLTLID